MQPLEDPQATLKSENEQNIEHTLNVFSIWNDYDKNTADLIQSGNASAVTIIEINRYLQKPWLKKLGNPSEWWKEREYVYPRLYILMKKKLCKSFSCEKAFF